MPMFLCSYLKHCGCELCNGWVHYMCNHFTGVYMGTCVHEASLTRSSEPNSGVVEF